MRWGESLLCGSGQQDGPAQLGLRMGVKVGNGEQACFTGTPRLTSLGLLRSVVTFRVQHSVEVESMNLEVRNPGFKFLHHLLAASVTLDPVFNHFDLLPYL